MKSVEEQIWDCAAARPDKTAAKSRTAQATYGELCRRMAGAADLFRDGFGMTPGETVVVSADSEIEFLYAYFGAHMAGLRVAPADSHTSRDRLDHIVAATNARLVVGFGDADVAERHVALHAFAEAAGAAAAPQFPRLSDIADIMFTSGTSGAPKGVPLTFGNEAAAARNINKFVGTGEDDVELLSLPLCHSFGLGRIRCCLCAGATLVLHGGMANAGRLFRALEAEGATGFSMVPAGWRYLRRMSGPRLGDFADRLRYVEMGSAPMSVAEKRELADLLPATRLCMHYGLTEASRSTFLEFHADAAHLDSVGRPSPGVTVAVLDDQGDPLPTGMEGEVCIGGEHVMRHYLVPEGLTEESRVGDLFRTGDMGSLDGDGFLHLSGRKGEQINVGGKKVNPEEVEEAIGNVDGVADCGVVGVADPGGVLGEVVKACVVRKSGSSVSQEEIREALTGRLEAWKVPAIVEFVDKIPTTENGKKQRGRLA